MIDRIDDYRSETAHIESLLKAAAEQQAFAAPDALTRLVSRYNSSDENELDIESLEMVTAAGSVGSMDYHTFLTRFKLGN